MSTFFKENTRKMVLCRGIKYGVSVPLEECEKCHQHGGYQEIKPAQNNLPPVEVIICNVPTSIKINYFVEGVGNKGKAPVKDNRR